MEIKVSISARVSIQDGEVNVNEILYEAKRFGDLLKKEMAEKIIEHYQEAIVSRMCDTEEGWAVEHIKKGADEGICKERMYTRHGYRKNRREMKTDFGGIDFQVKNVECKGWGGIFAPIIKVLKVGDWKRKTDGLTMKIADMMISKQSYGYSVGSLKDISGVKIPRSPVHRWIVGEDWDDLELGCRGEEITSVLVDGTGYRRQILGGGKSDIRYMIGISKEGEKRVLGVWANKGWEEIAKEVKREFEGQERPWMLTSDGEPGIAENLGDIARFHQRCIWHEKRDLGHALWRDGEIDRLSGIMGIQLPQGEYESIREEDRQGVKEKLDFCKEAFNKLIQEFEERGYNKAATYLKNSVGNIFSYVELWLEVGITSPRTTSLLENIIRQVGRRTKKIGATWSDNGIEKVVKIFLKKTYQSAEWEKYWKERMQIRDGCKINILSIDFEVMAS